MENRMGCILNTFTKDRQKIRKQYKDVVTDHASIEGIMRMPVKGERV